jgi:nucleoside-diphosphate-sugar epimerase
MPTALLTGTSGFVGGYLADALRETHEVQTLLRRPPVLGHTFTQWDLQEPLPKNLPENIDLVVHAAATDGRDGAAPDSDCFRINTLATAQLLDYATRAGVKQFVYLSTGSVYPLQIEPASETTAPCPVGHYAATKAAAECLLAGYAHRFDTLCLRLFYPYGPGQKLPRLIPGLIDKIRREVPIPLQGETGQPAINPLHIRDLVAWTSRLIEMQARGTYNLAGTETLTIRELAGQIAQLAGREVNFEIGPAAAGNRLGDISQVIADTGYRPQTSLASGLKELLTAN